MCLIQAGAHQPLPVWLEVWKAQPLLSNNDNNTEMLKMWCLRLQGTPRLIVQCHSCVWTLTHTRRERERERGRERELTIHVDVFWSSVNLVSVIIITIIFSVYRFHSHCSYAFSPLVGGIVYSIKRFLFVSFRFVSFRFVSFRFVFFRFFLAGRGWCYRFYTTFFKVEQGLLGPNPVTLWA